jgi:molybdopterin converting factor small subunit
MAQVYFTARLRSVVASSPIEVAGQTVGEALAAVFAENPQAKSYVLDEQGALRQHVCVFLDGERLLNNNALQELLREGAEIYVMQALSGG